MKICLLSAILVGVSLVAESSAQDAAKKDQAAMQGAWKVTKLVLGGVTQPTDLIKKISVVINDNKLTMKLDNDLLGEANLKLRPGNTPKQVDMEFLTGSDKGQIGLGIYELNGDVLKICAFLGTDGNEKRPTGFEEAKGMLTQIIFLERQKK